MTPEGQIKKDITELLKKSGYYVRALMIGIIPGRKNHSKGMPDIVCIKNGRVIWFEVKAKKGKVSEEQETFIFEWVAHGGEVYTVRSVEEVHDIIRKLRPVTSRSHLGVCTHCL